jgi:hypothetical protein
MWNMNRLGYTNVREPKDRLCVAPDSPKVGKRVAGSGTAANAVKQRDGTHARLGGVDVQVAPHSRLTDYLWKTFVESFVVSRG